MDSKPDDTPKLDARHAELMKRYGLTPVDQKLMERYRKRLRESGLSAEEYQAKLREEAERAQQRVDDMKQGWALPIVSGALAVFATQQTWMAFTGRSDWSTLLSLVGSSAIVLLQYDPELLPPRRRLILGLLLGGAVALLVLVS